MIAVTDSHALIWHLDQPRKLGKRARRIFDAAEGGRGVVVIPTTCLVEIVDLVHKGTIDLHGSYTDWLDDVERSPSYHIAPLTLDVCRAAYDLYAIPERSDRLVAATALSLGLPLITRDPAIAAAGIDVIWD